MLIEPFILSRQACGAHASTDRAYVHADGAAFAGPDRALLRRERRVHKRSGAATYHHHQGPLRHGGAVTHAGEHRSRDVDDEPLPTVTGAHRGELAFITAQHGEREGQAPRVHSVDAPAPTIAATGHIDVAQGIVTPIFDGQHYDILFRMLEPHELAAAMGFTSEDQAYQFAGTKTEQIKQIGNAVSVAKMKACVGAIMADAAPKRKAKPEAVEQPRAEGRAAA
jgi:site-specific DNA-cytosine methylase